MWWKIYFLLDIGLLVLSFFSFLNATPQNTLAHIFLIITYCVALVGLYFYAWRKPIRYPWFWREYFWFYLILDVIYFIYGILPPSYAHYFSFIAVYQDNSYLDTLINTAFDIPLLYVLYRVSQGKIYTPIVKKKTAEKNRFQWGMIQMALWGYSSVLIFFLFILAFFPSAGNENTKDVSGASFLSLIFAPLLIFWLWILIRYKQYQWNWWRMTLVANALLYSGTIIFGLLAPSMQSTSGGFDFIGILQLFILLVSLYVFGKDQFNRTFSKKTDVL